MFYGNIYFQDGSKREIVSFDRLTVSSNTKDEVIDEKNMLTQNFDIISKHLCFSSKEFSSRVNGKDIKYLEIFKRN